VKEFVRRLRDLFDCTIEGNLIGLRGLGEAAELPHELQRRREDFFLCRRRFEIVQSLNISTHSICCEPPVVFKDNYNASLQRSANDHTAIPVQFGVSWGLSLDERRTNTEPGAVATGRVIDDHRVCKSALVLS
jgi:hypothetical protein